MKVKFTKFQGTGNDFILFDNREGLIQHSWSTAFAKCCDRRFGIGADGIILLEKHPTLDFRMVYFNANGKEGSMCGNGGRCTVQFAKGLGIVNESCDFMAVDGKHEAKVIDGIVHLKMSDVMHIEKIGAEYFIDTGSPHHIVFVDALSNIDVYNAGKAIRNSAKYITEGTNVNFVQVKNENEIAVSTYERGVEDVTLSCGTGVTAAAIALAMEKNLAPGSLEVSIKTDGGLLAIEGKRKADTHFENLWLIGPAEATFTGEIQLDA